MNQLSITPNRSFFCTLKSAKEASTNNSELTIYICIMLIAYIKSIKQDKAETIKYSIYIT